MTTPQVGDTYWHYDYATEATVSKVEPKRVYLITRNGTTFHLTFDELAKFWKKKEEKHVVNR